MTDMAPAFMARFHARDKSREYDSRVRLNGGAALGGGIGGISSNNDHIDTPQVKVPRINPKDLGSFHLHPPVSSGSYGVVYFARFHGQDVAVKVLKRRGLAADDDGKLRDAFLAEVDLHAKLRHRNIVSIIGVSIRGPDLMLVTEYCHGKSLNCGLFTRVRRVRSACDTVRHTLSTLVPTSSPPMLRKPNP